MPKSKSKTVSQALNEVRQKMKALLLHCTEAENKMFVRMYQSVENIPDDGLDHACYQIERTLEKKVNNENLH